MYTNEELEDKLIDLAFAEDIGDGDHTTLCCIPKTAIGKSQLIISGRQDLSTAYVRTEILPSLSTKEVEFSTKRCWYAFGVKFPDYINSFIEKAYTLETVQKGNLCLGPIGRRCVWARCKRFQQFGIYEGRIILVVLVLVEQR